MPLYDTAEQDMKANLQAISSGQKPPIKPIGRLTQQQFADINAEREILKLPPLENPEVVYMGRHHYKSRSADGYSISDMYEQARSAMSENSEVHASARMTALENPTARADGYGNNVHDRAILELTQRKPRAELFSVIPKGDKNKPPRP